MAGTLQTATQSTSRAKQDIRAALANSVPRDTGAPIFRKRGLCCWREASDLCRVDDRRHRHRGDCITARTGLRAPSLQLRQRKVCCEIGVDWTEVVGYRATVHAYHVDEVVVVVGQGVGRVASLDSGQMVVHFSEGDVALPIADAEVLVRPVMAPEDAGAHLARLCDSCKEERTLPRLRSLRELTRAGVGRQVEYARWYFRKKKALLRVEADIVQTVSEGLVAELAASLGVDEADLRAAIKRGKPEITPRKQRQLPSPPQLEGCDPVRSFWLGKTALVGERPESGSGVKRVKARAGAWHAYRYARQSRPDAELEGLLLHHAEIDTPAEPLPDIDVGGVNLEGGTIGVLDAAALKDVEFGVDEVERTRHDGEGYGDRGIETATWGDGDHRILVDNKTAARRIFLPF